MTIIAAIRALCEMRTRRHSASKEVPVNRFENIGRDIDRELEKLRTVVENELKPATKRNAAAILRQISERLAKLADEIQARHEKQP